MNSSGKWIIMGIFLVFISGLFAGIVIERKVLTCHPELRGDKREGFSRDKALERLSKTLSLNKEQRESIDNIFEKHRPDFEAVHKQAREKLSALMSQMDKEISSVLEPQQKKKYENFIKERKLHHREKRF